MVAKWIKAKGGRRHRGGQVCGCSEGLGFGVCRLSFRVWLLDLGFGFRVSVGLGLGWVRVSD